MGGLWYGALRIEWCSLFFDIYSASERHPPPRLYSSLTLFVLRNLVRETWTLFSRAARSTPLFYWTSLLHLCCGGGLSFVIVKYHTLHVFFVGS